MSGFATKFGLAAAFSAALLLSSCGKAKDDANDPQPKDTGTKQVPKDTGTKEAGGKSVEERAKAISAKIWAYYDKKYNQKSPEPNNPGKLIGFETWGPDVNPATTSILLLGGLKTGHISPTDERVEATVQGLLNRQQASGSFDLVPGSGFRSVYITSFCVELLSWVRANGSDGLKTAVRAPVAKAMEYLKRSQVGNPEGPMADADKASNFAFGGWAYSEEELQMDRNHGKPRANMSTSIFALDAAAAFGLAKDDPLWEAATTFLTRSQNAAEAEKGMEIVKADGTTVVEPAPDDPSYGGSRYSPDSSMAGEKKVEGGVILASYGSMTYALLRGYLHAGLDKNDPRVRLASAWIKKNFDVTRVPGFDTSTNPKADMQGYYYQFMQMARTLSLLGEDTFEDGRGETRNWREEMLTQLEKLQLEDGTFMNEVDRWEEAGKEVPSGYVLHALAELIKK